MKTSEAKRFKDNPSDLCQFNGSETIYRNAYMLGMNYTEGIKHMADTRDAYWLIQLTYVRAKNIKTLKDEPFITIELSVADDTAEIVFTDGNDNILYAEDIAYTDYPDDGVCMWLVDGILLLPSEY